MPWQFLPPFIDLEAASISLGLPARTVLRPATVGSVATGDKADTTVFKLTLGPKLFKVDFTPSLVIDLPHPLVALGLGGIEYDLRAGSITPRLWYESEIGLPVGRDSANEQVSAFMRDLITCTPMAMPPYDPAADPELVLTVQQIFKNLETGGASIVRDISLSASMILHEEIAAEVSGGGFHIPAGATVHIQVDLAGPLEEVRAAPKIRRVEVDCSSLVLRQDGADQAELGRIALLPGGVLEVVQVRPLGAADKASAVESLVRLFGALGEPGAPAVNPADLEARLVDDLLRRKIQEAIHPALLQWVKQNATIVPGLDLPSVLGIKV